MTTEDMEMLGLNETVTIGTNENIKVTRVPGGFVYRFYDWQGIHDNYVVTAVFVPWADKGGNHERTQK